MDRSEPFSPLRPVLLAGIVVLLIATSAIRNAVYHSEITLWTSVVSRQPDKLRPHHNLGCALSRDGRHREALREFDTVLALKDDGSVRFKELFIERGNAAYHLGMFEDAVASWQKALVLSPGNAEVLTNIAVVRLKQGRTEDALGFARTALAVPDPLAETFEVLGEIALGRKEYEAAASYLLAAIEKKPGLSSAYRNAAHALAGQGRYDLAVRILDQFLSRGELGQQRDAAVVLQQQMREKGRRKK